MKLVAWRSIWNGSMAKPFPMRSSCYERHAVTKFLSHRNSPRCTSTNVAITATTPPFPTGGPLSEVGLGDDCQYGHCRPLNSACVTKPSNRECECVNQYVEFNMTCKEVPGSITDMSVPSIEVTAGPEQTGTIATVPFDGLSGFPPIFFTTKYEVIPEDDNINLIYDSGKNELQLQIVKPLAVSSSYGLYLSATSVYGTSSIHQIVHVSIKVDRTYNPKHITAFLMDRTRKNTFISDVKALGFIPGKEEYIYSLAAPEPRTRLLFAVEDKTGRVFCRQDISLTNIAAKEFVFDVKAKTGTEPEILIANYSLLVLKDDVTASVEENTKEVFLTYQLQSSSFEIYDNNLPSDIVHNNRTGTLKLMSERDYENAGSRRSEFRLSITTMDNSRQTSIRVVLNIADTNDEEPHFLQDLYTSNVLAGSLRDTIVGVVNSADADTTGSISYSILPPYENEFYVDSFGAVRSRVNLEKKRFGGSFNVTVSAHDGMRASSKNAIVNVNLVTLPAKIVNITNIYNVTILEEQPIGTRVVTVAVANYSHYHFQGRGAEQFFNLDSKTGVILTNSRFDRETQRFANSNEMYYDILANKDTEDQCTTETVGRLHYQIQDINDNYPTFDRNEYHFSIMENSPPDTYVSDVNIQVTDDDIGPNADILVQLSSSVFEVFKILENNYKIKLTAGTLDRESKAQYHLILKATDNPINITERKSRSANITITILDENDCAPRFVTTATNFTVLENRPPTKITTLSATDDDEGVNAEVRYMLKDGYGKFDIGSKTGDLWSRTYLDREIKPSYNILVLATDGSFKNSPTTLEITVNVGDINDNAPEIEKHLSFKRPEEQNCSSLNITIWAKDPDNGANGTVKYSTNSANFTIEPDTGVVTCTSPLDYEADSMWTFVVSARDEGTPPKTTDVTVEVVVLDINDHAPVFNQVNYSASIGEWRVGKIVLAVRVSDEDSYSNIKLSLNQYQDVFNITPGPTGIITINSPTHNLNNFSFTVTANDTGEPPKVSQTSVQIYVLGKGSNDRVQFSSTDYAMYKEENSRCSKEIGQVSIDPLHEANFTLLEGHSDAFAINRTSGGVKCVRTLDRELMDKHTLVVRASSGTDGDGGDVAIVTVHVTDVNDNRPEFELDSQRLLFQIREDVDNGSVVTTVKALDKDIGNNALLVYSILDQGSVMDFHINRTTGVLKTSQKLDREAKNNYVISVSVHDKGTPQLTSNTTVNIQLLDINDNAPEFTKDSYTASIKENATNGDELTVVLATDPDYNYNGSVTYNLNTTLVSNITANCPFQIQHINGTAGLVIVSAELDYETTPLYECVVTAVDMEGCSGSECSAQKTGSAILAVRILDYNDNAPQFQNIPYIVNISRDSEIDVIVTDICNATDRDEPDDGNGVVSYKLLSGNGYFDIGSSSGEITLRKSLAKYGRDDMLITIEAGDNPTQDNKLTTTTTMKIVIQDDNPRPWFDKKYSFNLTEEKEPDEIGLTLIVYDRKHGNRTRCNCTYKVIQSGNFTIDQKTAKLTQRKVVNREVTNSSFEIRVEATDDGDPPKSIKTSVNIFVKDTNDNRPYFLSKTQTFNVNQTVPESTIIGRLEAVDDDEDRHSISNYSAIDVDERIHLHANGTITVIKSLINPLEESYQIKFTVAVGDTPPLSYSADTELAKNNLALVIINVHYYDLNQHSPAFTKPEYSTSLDFSSKKNTEIEVKGLKATDEDEEGDGVTYRIKQGNRRDILRISVDTGKLYLNYDLDDTIESPINLTIIAVDQASYPKTGTCLVLITLKDTEPTQCIPRTEYSRLGEASKQKTTFTALFGVVVALLVAAVIIVIVIAYKWRSTKSDCEQYRKVSMKQNGQSESGYEGLKDGLGTSQPYRHFETRDFSSPVVNRNYVSADGEPSGRVRCMPPRPMSEREPEPEPDYDEPILDLAT